MAINAALARIHSLPRWHTQLIHFFPTDNLTKDSIPTYFWWIQITHTLLIHNNLIYRNGIYRASRSNWRNNLCNAQHRNRTLKVMGCWLFGITTFCKAKKANTTAISGKEPEKKVLTKSPVLGSILTCLCNH